MESPNLKQSSVTNAFDVRGRQLAPGLINVTGQTPFQLAFYGFCDAFMSLVLVLVGITLLVAGIGLLWPAMLFLWLDAQDDLIPESQAFQAGLIVVAALTTLAWWARLLVWALEAWWWPV